MGNILLWILMMQMHLSMAIVGFDCSGQHVNITTLSLLDIGECNYKPTPVNSTDVEIQLLQMAEYINTHVIQCKIEISRTVYYCGMYSHVSVVHNGRADYLMDISYRRCKELHDEGTIVLGAGTILTNIHVNSTTSRSVMLAGTTTDDGDCDGTQYSDHYGSWQGVVVQANVKITLKEAYVPVRLTENKIILRSGTVCKFTSGYCIDIDDGMTFWSATPPSKCDFLNYDVLYTGLATKVTDADPKNPMLYTLKSKDVVFALTQTGETQICGYRLVQTEHPRLYIIEGTMRVPTKPVQVENLDIFTYVNSKFVYVERHIRTQIGLLYEDVLMHRCNLERRVILNSIAFATQSPDEFAYTIMKSPGYMSVSAGEVVHIVRCIPVEVTIRQTKNCYNELPVTHGNDSYFLSPKSRILLKTGTMKQCNTILPTMYYINDNWIKFIPTPVGSVPPQQLHPQATPTWHYALPGSLATGGIYSNEDIENLRDHIMFAKEQPAILNSIVRSATGQSDGTVDEDVIYNLFNENTLEKLAESTTHRVWEGLLTFGSVSSAFIAIYIIYQIITLLINSIAQGIAIHKVYGCTGYILAGLCGGITNLLLQRRNTPAMLALQYPNSRERRSQPESRNNSPIEPHLQPIRISMGSDEIQAQIQQHARRLEQITRGLQNPLEPNQ